MGRVIGFAGRLLRPGQDQPIFGSHQTQGGSFDHQRVHHRCESENRKQGEAQVDGGSLEERRIPFLGSCHRGFAHSKTRREETHPEFADVNVSTGGLPARRHQLVADGVALRQPRQEGHREEEDENEARRDEQQCAEPTTHEPPPSFSTSRLRT